MNRLTLGLVLTLGSAGPVFAVDEFGLTPYEQPGENFGKAAPRFGEEFDRPGDAFRPTYGAPEFQTPDRTPDPFPRSNYERDMRDLFTQPSLRKHCDSPSRPSSLDKHCGGPY